MASSQQNSTSSTFGYKAVIFILLCLQAMMTVMWTPRLFGSNGNVASQLEELFSLPSQQRDCSNNTITSTSIQENAPSSAVTRPETNVGNSSDPCSALMARFHDINQHYRDAGDPASASPKPLINYAYYTGQGFGRLIDHTALHCVLALHLGRPCVLDMSTRDPYFTWRSFIHMGSYDWELQSGGGGSNTHLLEDYYREEIDKAVSEMKAIGHGSWENGVSGTYDKLFLVQDYPASWPEKGHKPPVKDFDKHIEEWRNEEKALFSPNWGLWFPRLAFPRQPHGCPHQTELMTKMQNALWQPTPLTLHLHKLRAAKVLSSSSSSSNIAPTVKHKEAQRIPPPPPAVTEPYGAIHVRTFFLNQAKDGEWRLANLQPILEKCLTQFEGLHGIKKWWILADKHPVAIELARNITTSSNTTGGTSSRRFDIRHGYSLDDGFVDNNEHSRMPEAQAMLAHQLMAPSVLDWTVLHESQVALITSGSFGITGARGRGKYKRRECDFFEAYY